MADDSVIGVIIASGHRDFCVGADIEMLHQVHDPAQMMTMVHDLNRTFRLLETGWQTRGCGTDRQCTGRRL